jgi:hypothetical protein
VSRESYNPFGLPLHLRPVIVNEYVPTYPLYTLQLKSRSRNANRNSLSRHQGNTIFCVSPLFGPLLFDNTDSDARDHCANERSTSPAIQFIMPSSPPRTYLSPFKLHSLTSVPRKAFLSYLRLSVYMAVVSIAIVICFHLKQQPTPLERRMSQPLGIIFWLLSLACLCLGFGNYMKTVNKYGRRVAIVQAGWKTQSVCCVTQFLSWCILL